MESNYQASQEAKEIRRRLLDRIKVLVKSKADNRRLPEIKLEGEDWKYDAGKNILYIPTQGGYSIYKMPKNLSIATILHELGHVIYSETLDNIVSIPSPAKEFADLLNSVEDIRIERKMMGKYPGTYDSYLAIKEHVMNGTDFAQKMTMPRTSNALVNLFNLEWNRNTTYKDEEVQEVIEEIWNQLKFKLNSFKSTEELFGYLRDDIWPIYKKLLEENDDQQEQQSEQQQQGQGQEGGENDMDSSVLDRLAKAKKDEGNNNQDEQNEQQNAGQKPEQSWADEIEQEIKQEKEVQLRKETADASDEIKSLVYRHTEKTPYEELLKEMQTHIRYLSRKLGSILEDNRLDRRGGSFRSGKLNHSKLYKFRCNQTNLFTRKIVRRNKNYAFALLIDQSGSMQGYPIQQVARATVLFAEVLNNIGVDFEILGFNEKVVSYKTIDQPFDWNIRKNLEYVIPSASGSWCGGTNDSFAILRARKALKQVDAAKKLIISITDGASAPWGSISEQDMVFLSKKEKQLYSNYDDIEARKQVREAEEEKIGVYGIGIDCKDVRDVYTNYDIVRSAQDIHRVVSAPIKKIIKRG